MNVKYYLPGLGASFVSYSLDIIHPFVQEKIFLIFVYVIHLLDDLDDV